MSENGTLRKLTEIFATFFKIGCFTFGGGYAMIPLIEREVIDKKKWVDPEDVVDVFAVAQSAPGAIAINSATFIGYKIAGKKGAFAATIGVIVPSLIIITTIAILFAQFQDEPIVKAAFLGIRSAVVGLILMAGIHIGKSAIEDKLTAFITISTIILILAFQCQAIITIIGGAVIGLSIYLFFPKKKQDIVKKRGKTE